MVQKEITQFAQDKEFLPFFHAFKLLKDDFKDEKLTQLTQKICKNIQNTDFNNLDKATLNKQLDVFAHIIASYPLKDCLEIIKVLYVKDVELIKKIFNRSNDGVIINSIFKEKLEQKASLINLAFFFDKAFNSKRTYRIFKTISTIHNKKMEDLKKLQNN